MLLQATLFDQLDDADSRHCDAPSNGRTTSLTLFSLQFNALIDYDIQCFAQSALLNSHHVFLDDRPWRICYYWEWARRRRGIWRTAPSWYGLHCSEKLWIARVQMIWWSEIGMGLISRLACYGMVARIRTHSGYLMLTVRPPWTLLQSTNNCIAWGMYCGVCPRYW